MTRAATRDDWKWSPMPEHRAMLSISLPLSAEERRIAELGVVPIVMEDKWFLFIEGGRLRCCRSWTGHTIFEATLIARADGGASIGDAIVNRDPSQYRSRDAAQDEETFRFVVEHILLGRPVAAPVPDDVTPGQRALWRHKMFGNGHGGNGVER